LAREALKLDTRYQGGGSVAAGEDLDALGEALLATGNVSGADSATQAAISILRGRLHPDHPAVLWSLANLGSVREAQGSDDEAMELFKDVISTQRRIFPNGHSELARAYGQLGALLAKRGRYAEAESLTVEAIAINLPMLGEHHSHILMLRHDLSKFRARLERR
jgi:tetratricopeptide (TPR) repeat protein